MRVRLLKAETTAMWQGLGAVPSHSSQVERQTYTEQGNSRTLGCTAPHGRCRLAGSCQVTLCACSMSSAQLRIHRCFQECQRTVSARAFQHLLGTGTHSEYCCYLQQSSFCLPPTVITHGFKCLHHPDLTFGVSDVIGGSLIKCIHSFY